MKLDVAKILSEKYAKSDDGIEKIIFFEDSCEDIKLLIINKYTKDKGIDVISFPHGNPFPSKIIEITPEEYLEIKFGSLLLPNDWKECVRYITFNGELR